MFGAESTDNLYFSVSAGQLGKGLDEQLARFVAEHPYTKLIIIDTLQKVREVGGDNYSYANDYQIMARLKSFTDVPCLCMLLVHTRKQNADDKFDMISGTSGLLGAADGAFLLQKEKRTGNAATLEVSGRDQQDQKLYLVRNTETLLWDLQRAETELLVTYRHGKDGWNEKCANITGIVHAVTSVSFNGGCRLRDRNQAGVGEETGQDGNA